MDFASIAKRHLTFFYFFGISPYCPNANEIGFINLTLAKLPKFIQLISCIYFASTIVIQLNSHDIYQTFSQIETLLLVIYVSFDVLRGILVFLQTIYYKEQISNILNIFQELELYFATKFDHHINYEPFFKKYYLKVIVIKCAYLTLIITFIIRLIVFRVWLKIGIPLRLLQLMQTCTFLHLIFYIDATCFHLFQLTKVVRRDTELYRKINGRHFKRSDIVTVETRLKCYKTVHFQLWEVSSLKNRIFGWCIIALLMHCFIAFVYSAFWLFDELKNQSGLIRKFRKFVFC